MTIDGEIKRIERRLKAVCDMVYLYWSNNGGYSLNCSHAKDGQRDTVWTYVHRRKIDAYREAERMMKQ